MNMRVDAAGGEDAAFSGKYLRRGADLHTGSHAVHNSGISRLADAGDPAVTNGDVRLVDSLVIENQCVRDHQVGRTAPSCRFGRLSHAVPDHFAAAELHFVAVHRPVLFDFDDQPRISKAYAIPRGRAEMV